MQVRSSVLVQKGQYVKIFLYTSRLTCINQDLPYIHHDLFIYISRFIYIVKGLNPGVISKVG